MYLAISWIKETILSIFMDDGYSKSKRVVYKSS